MKNKFVLIVSVIILIALCVNVSATSAKLTYEINNVTIKFDAETTLEDQEKEKIAHHLAYGETTDSVSYGLWCTLWGHSYETHTVEKITHCVYETNPRCQDDFYEVQICSRCEHTVSTRVATTYISCCPEE